MNITKQKQLKLSNETFVSSLQFSSCMSNAAWSKFSSLYFLENGINASELAVITSIQSISKLLGYPTFGIIADLFDNSKTLLLLSLISSNVILLLFYFPSTKTIIFNNFYLLLFIRGLRSYSNCIWSLIDAITMRLITNKKSYGKHRLYGSLAWGLSSLFVGKLIDIYHINIMFIYGLFWSSLTFGLILFFMPKNVDIDQDRNNFNFCEIFTLLVSMKHDYQFIFSLMIMLIYWNVMFIIDRIVFIQMDQEFGATKFMNGFATLCSVLPALPLFYYSANLMNKYSLNVLYLFCHIILALRLWLYLFCNDITQIWMIYLIEMLHGINFGVGFVVCRVYLYQIGENYSINNELGINVRATIQSLKGIINLFSIFSGSIIWLPLYDISDNAQTVYIYGSFTLIPNIIYLSTQYSMHGKLFNVIDLT